MENTTSEMKARGAIRSMQSGPEASEANEQTLHQMVDELVSFAFRIDSNIMSVGNTLGVFPDEDSKMGDKAPEDIVSKLRLLTNIMQKMELRSDVLVAKIGWNSETKAVR